MAMYVLISGTALSGKWAEARKAAHDSIKYLAGNSAYVGNYEILQPAGGPNKQYYWLCRFESAAEHEQDSKLRGMDPGWSEAWKAIELSTDTDTITSQMFWVRE
jgi:hypothetical protein